MVEFKDIKNMIRQYSRSSIIDCCFQILQEQQRQKIRNYAFWNLFVLLKWSFLHTNNFFWKRSASQEHIEAIVALMEKFDSEYPNRRTKTIEGWRRVLKIIAFQQFWTQDLIGPFVFERQFVLYSETQSSDSIPKEFFRLTGFTIEQFLNYCYYTWIYLGKDVLEKFDYDAMIHDDYYEIFATRFPPGEIRRFIRLLTINKSFEIISLQKLSDERHQLYETNFLSTKPFLHHRGYSQAFHKSVFCQTCKHFIYDYLKSRSPTFSVTFGRRLEFYIEEGLKEINISFLNEAALKRTYPNSKITDFYVNDELFLECKAIELHPRSGVLRFQQILSRELNESIVKSYCQMLALAKRARPNDVSYGLVVTYKEMYLGFGPDAWNEFLKDPIESFARKENINLAILPPENLCFIDIDSWDHLMQIAKEGRGSIPEIIEKAKSINQSGDVSNQVLLLEQVLINHYPLKDGYTLRYLQNKRDHIVDIK